METLLTDSKRRNDLIAKGKVRIQDFSWEKCGKETLKLLTSAAHKRA
jgi:glycosyltransferase involved in cell wall biosynthesis